MDPQILVLKEMKLELSADIYAESWKRILSLYQRHEETLPSDHSWIGKLKHVSESAESAQILGRRWDLSVSVSRLLSLTCFAHDLGRFPQAVMQAEGITCNPEHHGELSVDLLRDLEPLIPDAWLCFSEAVEKHSLRKTPQKREFVSEVAWALCSVIRDIDKMGGFIDAHAYTHDVGRKTKEAHANTLAWTKENPTAEMGAIVTLQGFPDVLQTFLEGQTITRAHCASYEAYMLQLLAWLYDFNLAEVRNEVIAQGGPRIVVEYLQERLMGNPQWTCISLRAKEAWGL